ncbi:MAG TPA: M23 family metallopeptidase [Solirubrobacterales bacterium]
MAATSAVAGEGGVSAAPAEETQPPPSTGRQVYPIRGAHQYWEGFGGARGHEGIDVGSRCGTPLVAAQDGRVRFAKYHARAGNYLVIDIKDSIFDIAYMHLTDPASVKPGQTVAAGQTVGTVGDTGNASGCHLHFELWEGAYYGGGHAIDPKPYLLSLEPTRKRAKHRAR